MESHYWLLAMVKLISVFAIPWSNKIRCRGYLEFALILKTVK